jgi:polyvinyl alcohol dehydrogenase (cytochrome)
MILFLTRTLLLLLVGLASGPQSKGPDGARIFQDSCYSCHHTGSGFGAPTLDQLHQMSSGSILLALESGRMKEQGSRLSADERTALADFLGTVNPTTLVPSQAACAAKEFSLTGDSAWNGWGVDLTNSRFQPKTKAGLNRGEVSRLKLKWAFGFPGASAAYGQPTVAGGRLFVGSEDGTVYSLDARTGCTYWSFKAETTVKTAVSIDSSGHTVFFGDTNGNVYAMLAGTGAQLWKVHVEPHPAGRITGSPVLVDDRLYVPVSSGEEGAAMDPHYACCTFRGSVVALDAHSGKVIWKAYTIPEKAKLTGQSNSAGTALWGPSGAAVWSSPTVDPKRHAIYVDTGNSYSEPDSKYSDAVLAFDLNSGKMLWSTQFTANDRWNIACVAPDRANCPQNPGNDFDFGSPPILRSLPDGKRLLIAAQKSGIVHALDPDHRGKVLWEVRIGHGGALGGIQWGGGADDNAAYFPRSDWDDSGPDAGGGLFALNLATGERIWFAPPPKPSCGATPGCSAAQMAPVTVIPQVVFSGSLDGHLRAYDSSNGTVIWDFDALHDFPTVNGAKAHGGSMNQSGPAIVDGMLYVNAGYTNAIDGNVLLAFSVDGK